MFILKMLLALVSLISISNASEIQYFDQKIDYWNDKSTTDKPEIPSPLLNEKAEGKFPWQTYLDPKNKEFFKEGDYTPPEPFMEIARNPSDENIKQWFEFMKKKNELSSRLQTRMQEYLAKNGEDHAPASPTELAVREVLPKKQVSSAPLDASRFRVRMYFESTCPHCRRMFGTLEKLQSAGIQVEALQVDSGPVPEAEKVVPISHADPSDLKKHKINGVPFLLIADTKRKALLPSVEGYHDFDEVMGLLKAASQ